MTLQARPHQRRRRRFGKGLNPPQATRTSFRPGPPGRVSCPRDPHFWVKRGLLPSSLRTPGPDEGPASVPRQPQRGDSEVQSRTGSGVCTGPRAGLREWACVRVTVTCALCVEGWVMCVHLRARTVRTGGFTKLLKFPLRAQRGAGPHPRSHSAGGQCPVACLLWFPFSPRSLCLQLHDADGLAVRKETPSAAERSSVRAPGPA